MFSKSCFGALEDAEGSQLGFGILIFTWIWSKPCLDLSGSFDHSLIIESSDKGLIKSQVSSDKLVQGESGLSGIPQR